MTDKIAVFAEKLADVAVTAAVVRHRPAIKAAQRAVCRGIHLRQCEALEAAIVEAVGGMFEDQIRSAAGRLVALAGDKAFCPTGPGGGIDNSCSPNRRRQTDSAEFKAWFGDSKVVDANGKPLVVYHGTRNAELTAFDPEKLGAYTGAESAKKAFFFSDSAEVAGTYPDGLHEVGSEDRATMPGVMGVPSSLAYRLPQAEAALERAQAADYEVKPVEDGDGFEVHITEIDEYGSPWSYDDGYVYDDKIEADNAGHDALQQLVSKAEAKVEEMVARQEQERITNMTGSGILPVYLKMENPLEYDFAGGDYREQSFSELIDEAKENGHDGVILSNVDDAALGNATSTVYAVFEPTQIKSAAGNDGSFDPKNPDIRKAFCPTGPGGGVDPTKATRPIPIVNSAPSLARHIFNPREWDEELVNRILPPLAKGMIAAARAQLKVMGREMEETKAWALGRKAFCPTGPGGGIDNSCSPNGGQVAVVPLSSFSYRDEDDEFLYHISPVAEAIVSSGVLRPGKPSMDAGFYRQYSKGKVFLTERSRVKWWADRIEQHLEAQYDNPPELAVVRIPRSLLEGKLKDDEVGNRDDLTGRGGSYYVEGSVSLRPTKAFCPTGPGGGVDPTCSPHRGDGGGSSGSGKIAKEPSGVIDELTAEDEWRTATIYANPNKTDLKKISNVMESSVRMFLSPSGNVYAWDANSLLHDEVQRGSKMIRDDLKQAIPIQTWITSSGRIGKILVTDYAKRTPWHHNPKTKQAILKHSGLKGLIDPKADVSYYDDRIVGDWEGLESTKASTASDWLATQDEALLPETFDTPLGKVRMRIGTEYPDWMKQEIQARLTETFAQPYWKKVNETTMGDIEQYLREGLENGQSVEEMARRMAPDLMEEGRYAVRRGRVIARTEMGMALNSARTAAIEGTIRETGIRAKRTWMSVLGNTTRAEHANLDGVPADEDGGWWLNGVFCRWPGDVSLPPGDRCNCFPGETLVSGSFVGAQRAWYEGTITEIVTVSGARLTVTPNHPIMTAKGWIGAGLLNPGDQVLAYGAKGDRVSSSATGGAIIGIGKSCSNQENNKPTAIQKIFETFLAGSTNVPISPPGGIEVRMRNVDDFYGDGFAINGEIEIVRTNWILLEDGCFTGFEKRGNLIFQLVDEELAVESCSCAAGLADRRVDGTSSGGLRIAEPLTRRCSTVGFVTPTGALAVGVAADFNPAFTKPTGKNATTNPILLREALKRNPGLVFLDDVVNVSHRHFSGYVYDLQSEAGVIVARDVGECNIGIVASNCQCSVSVEYGMGDDEANELIAEYELRAAAWEEQEAAEEKAFREQSKAFCPTGPGGGVDPTCSPNRGDGGGSKKNALESLTARVDKALQDAHLPRPIRESFKKSMTKALKKLTPKAHEVLDGTLESINFFANHQEMYLGIADHLRAELVASMSRVEISEALAKDGTVAMTVDGKHLFLDGSMPNQLSGPHADQTEMGVYLHEICHVLDRGTGFDPAAGVWGSDVPYWQAAWAAEIQPGQITTVASSRKLEGWAEFGRLAYSNPRAARRDFPQSWAVWKQRGLVE